MALDVSVFRKSFFSCLFVLFWSLVKRSMDDESCVQGPSAVNGSTKRLKPAMSDTEDVSAIEEAEDLDSQISHHNQPVLRTVYRDPDTLQEKVCLVASLPGGSENVAFSLVGSGPGSVLARVTYSWPPLLMTLMLFLKKNLRVVNRQKPIPKLKQELEKTGTQSTQYPKE